jgi:hypothetical protein
MKPQTAELIESALRTWPLAETPPGFSKNVLEQIKPRPSHAPLKFRLTWMDYALGLFASSLPVLGIVSLSFLPRQAFIRLQYQLLLLQSPAYEPLLLFILGALGLLGLLVFLFSLRFLFNRQIAL